MRHNRIRMLMDATGMTVRDFAKANGLSEQTLYDIRRRENIGNVSVDVFIKIAHGLGMTAEELYYGEDVVPKVRKITDGEREIIDAYRRADANGQEAIRSCVRSLSATFDKGHHSPLAKTVGA